MVTILNRLLKADVCAQTSFLGCKVNTSWREHETFKKHLKLLGGFWRRLDNGGVSVRVDVVKQSVT